jgi:putative acetyltransferase
MIDIRSADFDHPEILSLLAFHVNEARANSPPGLSFALDLAALKAADLSFYAAWRGEDLAGLGALKALSNDHGEIKSMRTAPAFLRRGVANAMLEHLIAIAKARGYRRVSLETGAGDSYEPALALYRKRGFVKGAPFGDYPDTPFNQCFHLDLA